MDDKKNLSELPTSWVLVNLSTVIKKVKRGPSLKCNQEGKGIRYITSGNLQKGKLNLDLDKKYLENFDQIDKCKLNDEDLILNCVNSLEQIGKSAVFKKSYGEAIVGFNNYALELKKDIILPNYANYFFQTLDAKRQIYFLIKRAVNQVSFATRELDYIVIPIAPLAEQHRMVAKIEELFSELDAGVELLKKLKAKLKRYRQAVLKAAVEGKLTKDWREAHQGELEPASLLLERILKERREKWEAQQLAQMKAKGKTPKDDSWKLKYKEPVAPDISDLLELPEGWKWISLDYVLSKIEAGKSFKCEERTPTVEEVGVVKVSAVTWGEFNEFESKTCLDLDRINPQLFVKEGNFLFSRANTIELVGACVIAKQVNRRVMLSDKILRFYFVEVPSKWILFALRTRLGRNEIERLSTGNQESMRNIGQERIRRIRIPLPPVQEIQQIVSELERRFSVTDELEKVLNQNLKRAEKLRQSILKKAFEGKLVPQDPTDEPADKLLERIKAEKAKREAEAKAKKKRKQPGKSQQLELF